MSPLARGGNVALTREIPALRDVLVSLRWKSSDSVAQAEFTHMAVLCDKTGKALSEDDVVFFNQMSAAESTVQYIEDPSTPIGAEEIEVSLPSVPAVVERIVFIGYLNEGISKNRTLGRLDSCTVSVYDIATGNRVVSSEDLAAGFGQEKAVVLGELYRRGETEWKFRVVGQGYSAGLSGAAGHYGLAL